MRVVILSVMLIVALFVWLVLSYSNWRWSHQINMIQNGSFEHWIQGVPRHWVVEENVLVFDQPSEAQHGAHCVGILCHHNEQRGIYQMVHLDPDKTYMLTFALKSNSYLYGQVGYEIQYCNPDVKASIEFFPGKHYYAGAGNWEQYYGQIRNASCVVIKFFACCGSSLLVDNVRLWSPSDEASSAVHAAGPSEFRAGERE